MHSTVNLVKVKPMSVVCVHIYTDLKSFCHEGCQKKTSQPAVSRHVFSPLVFLVFFFFFECGLISFLLVHKVPKKKKLVCGNSGSSNSDGGSGNKSGQPPTVFFFFEVLPEGALNSHFKVYIVHFLLRWI